MNDHVRLPAQPCPNCRTPLDTASGAYGPGVPKPDDLTICLACGAPLQWDPAMRLVELTDELIERVPTRVLRELAQAKLAWVAMMTTRVRQKAERN